MRPGPRLLAAGVAVAFVLSSCGGSDSDDDAADSTVATTEEDTEPEEDFTPAETDEDAAADTADTADTTEQPVATGETPDTAAASTDATPDTADAASEAEAVDATMVEWSIDAPTDYTAGDVTFNVTNNGSFPHEFVVIQGDGYESLPLADGGAVIEDDLPAGALLDRIPRMGGGDTAELTVTLEAGNYVLLCNLGSGSNSHAGQGQFLDITVS